jgi:outer membrane receptor protein involved in Fe transport
MIMKTLFIKITILLLTAIGASGQKPGIVKLDSLDLKDLLKVKITTAAKTSQALELASATVTVVTKEQIKLRGYQSLLDVMYDLNDVKVDDKMYSGMRNSFTVRGTQGSEKFMILLDGISISSPSGEAMAIMQNYPVNLAEQIEILYGPASALYGANAVSGVINIITKKTPKKKFDAEISSTTGVYGYTNTTLFLTKKLGSNTSLVMSGQYFYDRGPDYSKVFKNDSLSSVASYATGTVNTIFGPFTPVAPITAKYEAPMEAYNIYGALYSGGFSFSFFKNYFKLPTALGNNTSNAIFNKNVSMGQSITLANASYKKIFNKIASSTALTVSKYNMDPSSNYRNLYTAMEPAYKYSMCTMIKAEQQVDYKVNEKLNITAGAEYENYNAVPQSADLAAPVNTNGYIEGTYLGTVSYYKPEGLPASFYFIQYNHAGAYVQAQYSGNKLNLTLGARYDRNSQYGASFNPRIGAVYQPTDKTTIKLLYGSAFRAPAPSDLYSQYGSFETADSGKTYHSYFLHLPNAALKPVRSYNTELSIQQSLSDNIFITVDGYFTAISGLYAFSDDNQTTHLYNNVFNGIPVDYVEVFTNSDRQKNYGGSLQLNWKKSFNKLHFNSYASLSFVTGVKEAGPKENLETGKDIELDFISPVMIRLGTDLKTKKFTCSPRLVLMGKQNISGIRDTTGVHIQRQTIPGYALLNISLAYNVTKQFSIFTNVSNALNQRYRNVSFNMDLTKTDIELYHGQPQDPIRIMGGFNFNF